MQKAEIISFLSTLGFMKTGERKLSLIFMHSELGTEHELFFIDKNDLTTIETFTRIELINWAITQRDHALQIIIMKNSL